MSRMAATTNTPTTSFYHDASRSFRTFTPSGEELGLISGHSTLGIAAAVAHRTGHRGELRLASRYGEVRTRCDGDLFEVRLPSGTGDAIDEVPLAPLAAALGVRAADVACHGSVLGGSYVFAEVAPEAFAAMEPNVAAIRSLAHGSVGVFVTAAGMVSRLRGHTPECCVADGAPSEADFTVRNFLPKVGIDEDIATGSIQAHLHAYWGAKLGKRHKPLLCLQASRRGGFVRSRGTGDGHVYVAGQCAFSFSGTLPL